VRLRTHHFRPIDNFKMGRPRKTESEKRKTNRERYQRFRAKQVNIGEEINRWNSLKLIVGTERDVTLAKLLIDK